ncbi:DNA (Cytosine-5)-methyltransferase DRM1/2 isoform 3 [Hibiscus syriacus]|uniref:DNA (Cytosine-5)-methyltransferase DRM1/2 isoform 3 n=1 Tax=Hibiscus syriacus TaxID=106335 RepID=A0A6A3D923_HIBSY|nr:DNA (Cytosine-5)-methyltransferase DRM1/2 isoform 3 [Hibiscus syriacus]
MQHVDSYNYSSDYKVIFQDDFTNIDSSYDTEEILNYDSDEENKLLYLTKMGYSEADASIAMERCGPDSSIAELTDFICDAQMAKTADALLPKKHRKLEKKLLNEDDHVVHLSNIMMGFGVSTEPDQITQRTLPDDVIGPPYFYYENVALSPVGVWTEMSRYLYNVGRNKVIPLEPDEVEMLLEVAFYCLGIPLKKDAQELNGERYKFNSPDFMASWTTYFQ